MKFTYPGQRLKIPSLSPYSLLYFIMHIAQPSVFIADKKKTNVIRLMFINIPRTRRIKNGSDIVSGEVSVFSNKIHLCCHFVADEIAAEERNEYCQSKTKAGCTAPVYAMFDGEPSDRSKRWRCYFSEAVKVNDMGQVEYDISTNSNCYVTIEEAEFFDII